MVFLAALLSSVTVLHAGEQKSETFYSADGRWTLKVRKGEAQFIEKNTPQIWRGSLKKVPEAVWIKSTFAWTYVVVGEADELTQDISMRFAREDCRDERGKSYPFSVTLRFENNDVERGCGKRLP